jgi:hypothetical protein
MVDLSALHTSHTLPPNKYPGTLFRLQDYWKQTEGIGHLRISKHRTGNWTKNYLPCGAVPLPPFSLAVDMLTRTSVNQRQWTATRCRVLLRVQHWTKYFPKIMPVSRKCQMLNRFLGTMHIGYQMIDWESCFVYLLILLGASLSLCLGWARLKDYCDRIKHVVK